MTIEILFSFAFATFALAFSPGPDNIFVLTQSIVKGRKFGLATVFGLMTGCIVHTTLIAFGVSAIIKENEKLFFIIKLFGALYLLYLAYQVLKSDTKVLLSAKNTQQNKTIDFFRIGFIMNVLNPKVTIFFLAFFPRFLFSDAISTILQFYILGLIFILVSTIVFSSIAIFAGEISKYIKESNKIGLYLKWGQILVFCFIALFILI